MGLPLKFQGRINETTGYPELWAHTPGGESILMAESYDYHAPAVHGSGREIYLCFGYYWEGVISVSHIGVALRVIKE